MLKFVCAICLLILNTLNAVEFASPASLKSRAISNIEDRLADIDSVVNETLQKFNVPGIAVGIVATNEIIFSNGYGMRDLDKKLPVTENTLFPIGSCTKAFTTLILAQLVDEKLISWDDLVISYIPEFQLLNESATSEITIRDLVAHRTGVPRHDMIWYCKRMARSEVLSCLRHLEPICPLRTKWYYNNLMYSVAGIVIERITGQSWEEAIYSRIFSPLKMASSNTSIKKLCKKLDFSLPYAEINGEIQELPFHSLSAAEPGGAINSNIVDMLQWVQIQLGNESPIQLVKRDGLEEMHSLQIPVSLNELEILGVSQLGYGLGWSVGDYKGHSIISHDGCIDGFYSEILLLPQKNMGLVILSNSSSDGIYAIASIRNTILDRLLNTCDIHWIESIKTMRDQVKELLIGEEEKELRNAPRCLRDYVGHYEHPAYGDIEIYLDNNQLLASYGDMIIDLNYDQDNIFKWQMHQLLKFGIKRITDFVFQEDAYKYIHEVHISFEPDAKPLIFKRK